MTLTRPLTQTQRRITELWAKAPASRTKHRQAELQRLVWRDLKRTARLAENARASGREA